MLIWPRQHWPIVWDAYPHWPDFDGVPRSFVLESACSGQHRLLRSMTWPHRHVPRAAMI